MNCQRDRFQGEVQSSAPPPECQQSWGDDTVQLHSSAERGDRLRIMQVAARPSLRASRRVAITGLCALPLVLGAIVISALNGGSNPQVEARAATVNRAPLRTVRRAERLSAHRRAISSAREHQQTRPRADRRAAKRRRNRAARRKAQRYKALPVAPPARPPPASSMPAPVAPAAVAPPAPAPAPPARPAGPEFGL